MVSQVQILVLSLHRDLARPEHPCLSLFENDIFVPGIYTGSLTHWRVPIYWLLSPPLCGLIQLQWAHGFLFFLFYSSPFICLFFSFSLTGTTEVWQVCVVVLLLIECHPLMTSHPPWLGPLNLSTIFFFFWKL